MSEAQDQQGSQPLQTAQQFTKEQIAAAVTQTGFHFCGARRVAKVKANRKIANRQDFFTSLEHLSLGDNLDLRIPNLTATAGEPPYTCVRSGDDKNKFCFNKLDPSLNAQELTYGEINALAGDFYGTYDTITGSEQDAKDNKLPNADERKQRFLDSWYLLARQSKSVAETQEILKLDKKYEDVPWEKYRDEAKAEGHQPSWVFAKKMAGSIEETAGWVLATNGRNYEKEYPGYGGLLLINWDHFGNDAHMAYTAGHTVALEKAIEAGKESDTNKLKLAYAINAFADHFLEDSFAAGHLRTPRRELHGGELISIPGLGNFSWPAKDMCSNYMHDEDGALGVHVRNKKGDEWMCYGDDYIFDDKAQENLAFVHKALQCSVDEVWDAYHSQKMPTTFEALELAPIPESASEERPNSLAPLFKFVGKDLERRDVWQHAYGDVAGQIRRRDWSNSNYLKESGWLGTGWVPLSTYIGLSRCGWWNYPMQLDEASK